MPVRAARTMFEALVARNPRAACLRESSLNDLRAREAFLWSCREAHEESLPGHRNWTPSTRFILLRLELTDKIELLELPRLQGVNVELLPATTAMWERVRLTRYTPTSSSSDARPSALRSA